MDYNGRLVGIVHQDLMDELVVLLRNPDKVIERLTHCVELVVLFILAIVKQGWNENAHFEWVNQRMQCET